MPMTPAVPATNGKRERKNKSKRKSDGQRGFRGRRIQRPREREGSAQMVTAGEQSQRCGMLGQGVFLGTGKVWLVETRVVVALMLLLLLGRLRRRLRARQMLEGVTLCCLPFGRKMGTSLLACGIFRSRDRKSVV